MKLQLTKPFKALNKDSLKGKRVCGFRKIIKHNYITVSALKYH